MRDARVFGALAIMATIVAAAAVFRGGEPTAQAQAPGRAPRASQANRPAVAAVPDASFLRWPVAPADQIYTSIDGMRIKGYVKELTAISRRYRDAGHQYWGRLIGLESDKWTAEWLAQKFRDLGAVNVRIQPIDLPPQWVPKSWDVTAVSNGQTVTLPSVQPGRGSIGIAAQELEAVYVGLGTDADYAGRDVRGKAAFIYGMPLPGARTTSASLNGTFQRAIDKGAAAIFLVVGLPGNIGSMVSVISRDDDEPQAAPQGRQVPAFTLGSADGDAVRRLIESAPAGRAPRIKVRLDVEMVAGLKTANVWGEIPGTGDEDVMLIAHRDGYFEAAGDNATGVASLVALAEHFAKMPKEQRRRTIRVVGTPGHHGGGGSAGVLWMAEHKDTVFPKTAYLINLEHTGHAQIIPSAGGLTSNNVQGNYSWGATGSPAAIRIATGAYDAFGIPRRPNQNSGGPGAEGSRIAPYVPASTGIIHAAALYHTDAETDDTIPAYGVEASTRAYAKIIDEVNKLSISELKAPSSSTARQ